jgi:hypothetical protein
MSGKYRFIDRRTASTAVSGLGPSVPHHPHRAVLRIPLDGHFGKTNGGLLLRQPAQPKQG